MKTKVLFLTVFLLSAKLVFTQELNCQVTINYDQIQGSTNKQIFDQLKRSVLEFMNNTKWTTEIFSQQEKIDCSFLIIIKQSLGGDIYSGSIQVTSNRPVFKSSYATPVLNIEDEFFQFKFQQFSQLEFNINSFQNNLTSVLAYYAYVVLATDYDTFAPLGGTNYWQKAQLIVQNAQGADEAGWKQSQSGQKNRYWLTENTLQPLFKGIRDCMYSYNLSGLDHMSEGPEAARTTILTSLELLIPVAKSRPASFNMQVFFNAKRDEIINIFKGGTPEEKTKVLEILSTIDPAGTTKYQKISG
ncbi:DUF4835 family protein [Aurantibacillus circumpalustris]|uniref:type IX secretion system protein PorD n=1 Tax=Aurantibacillus circumpalustris TaxID=3036359 RepID=UPI00295B3327|nr:DUF4835 family protein [Aurantibacillus circumpalustris]